MLQVLNCRGGFFPLEGNCNGWSEGQAQGYLLRAGEAETEQLRASQPASCNLRKAER